MNGLKAATALGYVKMKFNFYAPSFLPRTS